MLSVSALGIPSKNSSVPTDVSTLSGVRILSGMRWLKPGVAWSDGFMEMLLREVVVVTAARSATASSGV